MAEKLPLSRGPSLPEERPGLQSGQTGGDHAWDEGGEPASNLSNPALYAGLLSRRILAYLMDAVFLGIAAGLLWFVLVIMTFGLLAVLLPVIALLPILYHGIFVGRNSATPGMRLMGLEVRTLAGARPDYFQAFLLAAIFLFTIVPTAWLVLLVALFNERRRTLHDWVVGTVVVRREALNGPIDTD